MNKTQLYIIFHLNLCFSSIEEALHARVIKQCYWPLLKLIKNGLPAGIELTAYTLEQINTIDPCWVNTFRDHLQQGDCELIAAGDSQLIGPLLPARLTTENIRLGLQSYGAILATTPRMAYINEQAVSAGNLDVYIDSGFDAVIIEWDNPYSHCDWPFQAASTPHLVQAASGRKIPAIWNSAISFQKFQRYAHKQMTLTDYLEYLQHRIERLQAHTSSSALPIYGNDAEVFDFRPGRYATEPDQVSGEWSRIEQAIEALSHWKTTQWRLPSELIQLTNNHLALTLTTPEHPVSVKKQAKYNLTRWALSGWNDLVLNTSCFQRYQQLIKQDNCTQDNQKSEDRDASWRSLCRAWASDYRTHLTEQRYRGLVDSLDELKPKHFSHQADTNIPEIAQKLSPHKLVISQDDERGLISLSNEKLQLTLNTKRGLAIGQLAFAEHKFNPIIGTRLHGYFDHILFGADYYSNHLVMERYRERDRITDLNSTRPNIADHSTFLTIQYRMKLACGDITKWYRIYEDHLVCGFIFHDKKRPEASIRLGYHTLMDCDHRCWFETHLGGQEMEFFQATQDFDHGRPISSIVSATTVLGATEGQINFGSQKYGLALTWNPAQCAALPMVSSQTAKGHHLNRLWFSLAEADETLKAGGELLDFSYSVYPITKRPEEQP